MYVKQVIIQGFKSYKEQTVIEPFSSKHNVIVGRNGSGKSNFFAAIRFVLGDAYTQMGREERQALLHEGTGAAVMSAFVEIIFDNSDDRFPTGKPELVLRRTIGSKKDEYTLDRKNATRSDVMNLLESAGFSRSNPYYIVPQGRVTALTNMKDGERLTLLKEVAGTQVYEARRTESLKIMQETDNKRGKIDDLLNYIKDRLEELEEEKEELRDYQEKDKERRCLQYTIDHREQMAIANELDVIDGQRQDGVNDTDESRNQFIEGEKQIEQIDREIKQLKQEAEFLRVDKRSLEADRREAAKEKARLELDAGELTAGQQTANQNRQQMEQEAQSIRNDIAVREQELLNLAPDYNARTTEEAEVKQELDQAEATRQRLYAKQSRNSRFKSKKERDAWLDQQIDSAYPRIAQINAVRVQTQEETNTLGAEIEKSEGRVETLRAQLSAASGDSESREKLQEAKAEREKYSDAQKELWREEAKLRSMIDNAKRELYDADRRLYQKMDKNTSRGLESVRRIVKQHKIGGVYGTLSELMEVDKKFKTAVEVVAGNSLFHYVVDSDETASRVLEILNKERGGRVTFMPLNRLRPRPANVRAQDAIPILDRVKYDEDYTAAFQQVFGKTIVCPSVQVASQYARSHGVSAITLDGDRSDKKGALTGGYIDDRHSRLDAVRAQSKWRKDLEEHENRLKAIERELLTIGQQITKATSFMRGLEQAKLRAERGVDGVRQEIRYLEVDLQNKRDAVESKTRALGNVEASSRALGEQQSAYEAEKKTSFQKALTDDEEKQLERLSAEVQNLRKQYAEISATRGQLHSRKQTAEIELRENYRPRLDQLQRLLDEQGGGASEQVDDIKRQLKRATKSLSTLDKKYQETEQELDQKNARTTELEQSHADAVQQQSDLAKSIERQKKRMEKSIQKKSILQKQANEVAGRIRDLGVLPQEAFAKFEKMKSEAVVKRLHKVNEALKKYSHVNKKAFQQYDQFTGQREQLTKRRAELDSSQNSIEELIAVLDQRKDEAIERTFKQVSKEFAQVFETLVPAGRGRLIIQRRQDRGGDPEADSDDEERSSIENYTGVGIAVSFNSKHDDQQRIQQLSGGQKSLCALALVFAIQRCDPAPFYLFDEIDANLDAQYRTAVAQMLQNVSNARENDGQFICTTFRPEMLLVADKCYGVRYVGKSSSVDQVSREEAMEFVQGEAPR